MVHNGRAISVSTAHAIMTEQTAGQAFYLIMTKLLWLDLRQTKELSMKMQNDWVNILRCLFKELLTGD